MQQSFLMDRTDGGSYSYRDILQLLFPQVGLTSGPGSDTHSELD